MRDVVCQELDLYQVREVYRCVLHTILFNRAVGWVRPRDTECEVLSRISYARIDDAALQRNVDKNVDALYAMIDKHMHATLQPTVTTTVVTANHAHSAPQSYSAPAYTPTASTPHTLTSTSTSSSSSSSSAPSPVPATLTLSFYESTPGKSWFGPREDKLYWERWVLPCRVSPNKPNASPTHSPTHSQSQSHSQRQQQSFMSVMCAVVALVNEKRDHMPAVKGGMEGLTYSFECESVCGGGASSAGLGSGSGAVSGSGDGRAAGVGVADGGGDEGGWGLSKMMKKAFKEGPPLLIPK